MQIQTPLVSLRSSAADDTKPTTFGRRKRGAVERITAGGGTSANAKLARAGGEGVGMEFRNLFSAPVAFAVFRIGDVEKKKRPESLFAVSLAILW